MERVMKEREMKEAARTRSFVWLLLIILACTACGPTIIKGRPPFISISELSLQGDRLSVDFNISNPNGEAMNIDGIEIAVRVEEAELTRYNEDFKLMVGANSTEVIEVEQFPDGLFEGRRSSQSALPPGRQGTYRRRRGPFIQTQRPPLSRTRKARAISFSNDTIQQNPSRRSFQRN